MTSIGNNSEQHWISTTEYLIEYWIRDAVILSLTSLPLRHGEKKVFPSLGFNYYNHFHLQAYEKRISMDNEDIDGEYTQRKAVANFLAKVSFSLLNPKSGYV